MDKPFSLATTLLKKPAPGEPTGAVDLMTHADMGGIDPVAPVIQNAPVVPPVPVDPSMALAQKSMEGLANFFPEAATGSLMGKGSLYKFKPTIKRGQ